MKVTVDLNPRDLWLLSDRAEMVGQTLPEYLASVVASNERPTVPTAQRVRELVRQGMCDADIASVIHGTPGGVARVRRSWGLPANRRFQRVGK